MRKLNAILTALILGLFLVHGIMGAFQLTGLGSSAGKAVAWVAVALIAVHTVIGIRLTVDTLKVRRMTGVSYFRQNALFWARRISGLAVMLTLGLHLVAFGYNSDAGYRLRYFGSAKLAGQILLVASLAVHLISNIRPLLIAFGIRSLKKRVGEILAVLSVLLLFMAIAMVIYFIRWNRM